VTQALEPVLGVSEDPAYLAGIDNMDRARMARTPIRRPTRIPPHLALVIATAMSLDDVGDGESQIETDTERQAQLTRPAVLIVDRDERE
jgi:hypothetical protein